MIYQTAAEFRASNKLAKLFGDPDERKGGRDKQSFIIHQIAH
jgi:hypothetical protein